MTSPMEQIADRLKTALKLCDVLTASVKEASPVIEGVRTKLENLILQHAGFTSASADAAKTEEIRSQLLCHSHGYPGMQQYLGRNKERLRRSLPVFAWNGEGKLRILDGHRTKKPKRPGL
ncbi:hypothetical protein LJK88_44845 [Paenibacillus sp. P26]|nr:hypothetical protein LJK88_44845 [Paenibacillus sp. P26]